MSFKFNWGHGLFLAMALFVVFIGSFVYKVMLVEKYDHKLVSEEYYKDELHYQDEIDKLNRAGTLASDIKTAVTDSGLFIQFPDEFNYKDIKASLNLQRLSDNKLDIIQKIELDSINYLIPDKHLVKGFYNLKIDWEYQGNTYQYRERIEY